MVDVTTDTGLPQGLEQLGFGDGFRDTLHELLDRIHMFHDLPHQDIEVLAQYVNAYHAPAGLTILREGARDPFMCFIAEGKVEVYKEQNTRATRKLATIRAGKSVGEMSLIDDQPHSGTVIAATDCTLLLLSRYGFERLGERHPRVALALLWRLTRILSHRLRQTSGQLIDFL